jgi:chromosome segregation ATPase
LSYSGGSGRSYGNRGFASQRKEKKKKQEYHKHHLKYAPKEHQSLEQLKERVSIGLQKLGTQIFSSEPGGYTFHNWMKSFNLLLDDFEEKCQPAGLPKEYYDTRLKLTAQLLEPVDTTALDSQIEQVEKEILAVEEKIAEIAQKSEKVAVEEWHEDEAKIIRLKRERSQIDLDLVTAKENLEAEKKKANQSVFKRLFSGSEAVKPLQARVDSLISRRGEIESNLQALEEDRTKKKGDAKKYDSEILGLRATLEELKTGLGEVQAQKQAIAQISEKRAAVTKSMAEAISLLHFAEPSSDHESNVNV